MKALRRAAFTTAAIALTWVSLASSASAATAPTALLVPGSVGISVLGQHGACNFYQNTWATGFAATSGYPTGVAHIWLVCGGKGWSHVYSGYVSTVWDFTGALVSYKTLTSVPTVNLTFSKFDAHGNHLYNTGNVSTTAFVRGDVAYLVLAAGFHPAPRVTSITPGSGPQGSTVTITGTGFTGATSVHFGRLAAVYTVLSATSISAVTPAVRTGTVDVRVAGPGGTSSTSTSDRFTFVTIPRVTGLTPAQGSADGGTSVTITGVNFTGVTAVDFGGVPASFRVVNDTSIVAVTPAGPDSGVTVAVTVTAPAGTSALSTADVFTYT